MNNELINAYATLKNMAEDKRAEVCKELALTIRNVLVTASNLGISIYDDGDPNLVVKDIYYDEEAGEIYFTFVEP